MQTALIVISIFIAIVLLVNSAAPQAKPIFKKTERLPQDVITANLRMLGVSCAVTKKGIGIKFSFVKPKRLINAVLRGKNSDKDCLWKTTLINNADHISSAFSDCKKDVINGAYCGHVKGLPRVFLFCKTLCESSGGDISLRLISDGLSAFEEHAKFTEKERELLPSYMIYCLVGCMCTVVSDALRKDALYEKGAVDGQKGKVALDYMDHCDYVCGLLDHTSGNELTAVKQLLDCNGLDTDECVKRKKTYSAYTYGYINAVLRSMQTVLEWKKDFAPAKHFVKASDRQIVIGRTAIAVLVVIYGTFTFIFASPRYVALFVVASVLTYAGIRIPLIYSSGYLWDFTRIFKRIKRKKQTEEKGLVGKREFMTETAYFGGGTEYASNSVKCGDMTVRADNRGELVIDGGDGMGSFGLELSCRLGETDIDLRECDGVFERYKNSYRLAKPDAEFGAQIVSALFGNGCLIELSVVNRTDTEQDGYICALLKGGRSEGKKRVQSISNGAVIELKGCFAALHAGEVARYGGNACEFLLGKPLQPYCDGRIALIGQTDFTVMPFAKKTVYVYVVFGKSKREAESVIRYISSDGFFEYATDCAKQFCMFDRVTPLLGTSIEKPYFAAPPDNIHEAPHISEEEHTMQIADVKFLPSAEYVSDDGFNRYENILSNGNITAKLDRFGVQSVSFGKAVTVAEDDLSYDPRAYVVIGEQDVLWSPSRKPIGKGKFIYKNGFGYSEYICAYNGTESRLRCFIHGGDSVIFELKIKNTVNVARNFDVMFSLLSETDNIILNDDAISLDGGLYLYASEHADHICKYKEGYFNRGKIDRASRFRDGGSIPSPTVSVKKSVEANGETTVSFALSTRAQNFLRNSDLSVAFEQVANMYNRLGKVGLRSDDDTLNISYKRALYVVYNFGLLAGRNLSAMDKALVLCCVKYINSSAVKDRLIEQASRQRQNGAFGSRVDGLYFVYSVMDYVNYSGDKSFLREVYPFLPKRSGGKIVTEHASVYEHCLRAIDIAVGCLYSNDNKFYSVLLERWTLLSINFFSDYIKQNVTREKRLLAWYRIIAERHARSVGYIKSDRFFKFKNTEEAYLCAYLLFAADENERAYNILKYNNPLERSRHYGVETNNGHFECGVSGSAIYYLTVTEMLLGISVRGKRIKISPKTGANCPHIEFDLYGRTKDTHVSIDGSVPVGNWKMRVDRINYSPDSVDISDLSGDVIFYRDGKE